MYNNKRMKLKHVLIILLVLALSAGVCVYNAFRVNPFQISVREEILESDLIPAKAEGSRIVYFSDLLYETENKEDTKKLVEKINAFDPDLIVFGGDLTAKRLSPGETEELTKILSGLRSNGKYAVPGEEDLNNREQNVRILNDASFQILEDRNARVFLNEGAAINLVGVSPDLRKEDHSNAFEGLTMNTFTLVCVHYPDQFSGLPFEKGGYVLAGHSLGGQVYFPVISLFTRSEGAVTYLRGKQFRNDTTLDITNGLGMRKEKVRFLADREFVVYRLTRGS